MVWFSWSSRQAELEFELQFSSYRSCPRWENQLQTEGLGSQDPGWAAQRKKCCYGREKNVGSICCCLSPSPTHLSHITNINPFATLSWIKCERYIFLKKCVRSSLLLTMFPCIVVYVLCGYTKYLTHTPLTGTTMPGQSQAGSIGKKGVLHTLWTSRTEALPPNEIYHIPNTFFSVYSKPPRLSL